MLHASQRPRRCNLKVKEAESRSRELRQKKTKRRRSDAAHRRSSDAAHLCNSPGREGGDWRLIRGKTSERASERESGSRTGRCRHRATAHHKQHMLTRRRLPQPIHGRFAASWVVHPSAASGHHDAPTPAVRPWSSRQGSSIVHRDRSCRLSTAAVAASSPRQMAGYGSMLLDIARPDGGVRWVSGTSKRFAKVKVAHGARRETPAIPSFIEIRYRAVAARLSR